MINQAILDELSDIFNNTEAHHKISVSIQPVSRSVRITYEDIDEEWFEGLVEALADFNRRAAT